MPFAGEVCVMIGFRFAVSVYGVCICLFWPGLSTLAQVTYEYDVLGRVVSVIHPDGKQTIYTYDAAGNRTAKAIHATVQNRSPQGGDDTYAIDEATVGEWDPRSNDTDADSHPLTITDATQGKFGAVEITQSGTRVRYTPTIGFIGNDRFTYTVDDGQGTYGTSRVSVTVNNVPPTANTDAPSVDENSSIIFDPRTNDSDPTGAAVIVTAVSTPEHGTAEIVSNGTGVKYTPEADYYGADSFNYTITGYHGDTAVGQVSVTVNSTNQAPVAANDAIQARATIAREFDPRTNDSDPDGEPITITAKTDGAKGSVSITGSGTRLSYTANAGATGTDAFTYTIGDPQSATSTATVNVALVTGNSAPQAVNDTVPDMLRDGSIYYFNPRANDSDPDEDPLTITAVTQPGNATVSIVNSGTMVKIAVPVPQFPNPTSQIVAGSFSYTVSDGFGGTDTATVSYQLLTFGGGGCGPFGCGD